MTFIPTQCGFIRPEGSEKLFTSHLPKLSQPETVPSGATSGSDCPEQRRSEQLAMFRITAEMI
jgi:hypothetical protein